ncbi:unnamed protein product, partial [Mesorhabditis spiculigera]
MTLQTWLIIFFEPEIRQHFYRLVNPKVYPTSKATSSEGHPFQFAYQQSPQAPTVLLKAISNPMRFT